MRILIAEDDENSRELLQQVLDTQDGWEVDAVADGAIAWWTLTDPEADAYDLLITDLHMPNVDGLDLLKRVRLTRSVSNLLILICSGNKDRDVIQKVIKAGPNAYILKPFEAKDVLLKVQTLLKSRAVRHISIELGAEEGA